MSSIDLLLHPSVKLPRRIRRWIKSLDDETKKVLLEFLEKALERYYKVEHWLEVVEIATKEKMQGFLAYAKDYILEFAGDLLLGRAIRSFLNALRRLRRRELGTTLMEFGKSAFYLTLFFIVPS